MLQWIKQLQKNYRKTAALGLVLLAAVFCLSFLIFQPVLAQQSAATDIQQGLEAVAPSGLAATDIRLIIANIIRAALGLLGMIALVLIIYGGYLYMTAGGNEEQIAQAKKVLLNATVGLIIILSAYGIVLFVMRMLGIGGLGGEVGPGLGAPEQQNFQGSGALGSIIKDHYPSRNQTGVARNTKIVITFRRPVKPSSFIQENSSDNTLGNCKQGMADWKTDCDKLILGNNTINITRADTNEPISGAAALVSYEGDKARTIVLRPYDTLGNSTDNIPYLVHLGPGILLDDPANNDPSAFAVKIMGNNYYDWQFTCSTELDTTPPHVLSTFPGNKTIEVKNSVIQIDFSEPIDPTGLQGIFNTAADNSNYYINGENIFATSSFSTAPAGDMSLTNGYRTLEFTPTTLCGANACGNPIFCLPVCDRPGANCKEDNYRMLVRAGLPSGKSFEAVPFSGVMDLAGNALDGNDDRIPQVATATLPVFLNWEKPDNYFWNFKLKDEIDLTAPKLIKIVPGLDAPWIKALDTWAMIFDKRMRVEPMYNIYAEEKPTPAERGDNIPLCRAPRVWFELNNNTITTMDHCPFLDGRKQYYFPVVTSTVEDVHFNCFYPGVGPGDSASINAPRGGSTSLCDPTVPGSPCCNVDTNNPLCCNGQRSNQNTATCLNDVKGLSL